MAAPLFKYQITKLLRFGLQALKARVWMLALLFVLIGAGAQTAHAQLTIKPITWNVIGLDSNKVTDGPDTFPVGARVCNTGGTTLNNVIATFSWDSSNIYINLTGNSTIASRALTANTCVDFYFDATVTRSSSAYNTSRRYHITATADGVGGVSTPTPRELFVEKLVSQARNQILSITGPTTVYVGNTYTYTVDASTATGGYEQLEAFMHLSNIIFQIQSVYTTYTSPPNATNDKVYADACGWDNNPLSPTYRSCIGPTNYAGGKAGDNIRTIYTVKVISTGTTTITSMIHDFSGSSYHYNADFGTTVLSVTALPPPLTLGKTANQSAFFGGGTVTYTLRLNNTSSYGMTINDFVDTLPTSPGSIAYVAGSSTFNGAAISNPTISGSTLTWVGLFAVPAGQTRDLTFRATIPNTVGNYVNSAVAHLEYSQVDTTSDISDNSPATVTVQDVSPPNVVLNKCVYSGAQCVTTTTPALAGSDIIYSISFTNTGGYYATSFIITDQIPANTDLKVGSESHTTPLPTGLTGVTVEYFDTSTSTWITNPASGGGGAPAGYNRNVTIIRWTFTGNLSQTPPNNTGYVGFTVRIR
jgi:uncharacterized repeat protein (TIGR01451 family)